MLNIDLNCDMGESSTLFAYDRAKDLRLLEHISAANIACGAHAGDAETMQILVNACVAKNIFVGAHPGFEDREHFGRQEMQLSAQAIYATVLMQLGALEAFLRPHNRSLHHVKPHGALYNMAARDRSIADAISAATRDYDSRIIVYGLAGSEMIHAAAAHGLRVAQEVFADRSYQDDGSLTPRHLAGAVIDEPAAAVARAINIIHDRSLVAQSGNKIAIRPDTLCIHGDAPNALALAQALRQAMADNNISIGLPIA